MAASLRSPRRTSVLPRLAAACALVLAGALGLSRRDASADSGPIRIGVVFPLSSAAGATGQQLLKGMNFYLDQVGHKMGGRPVEFLVENTESSPAMAVAKVHKLMEQDKVPLLTGMYLSNELYAIAPVVKAGQTPFVVVSAGADNVTQRDHSPYFVRTGYTGSIVSHPLGDYAFKKLGYKRVVTIANDYAYGYEVVGGFQHTFEQAGGKVVQKIWTPLGATDFSEQIKSIRKDADAVFMVNVGPSAELIPKRYAELGPKLPVLANHTSFDESVLQKIGAHVEGAYSVSTYSVSLEAPGNKKFVDAYKAKEGQEPTTHIGNGYLAAMAIDQAITAIHGDVEDKAKLIEALRKIELKDAPHGPIKLDEYGQAVSNVYLRKVVKVGDRYVNKVVHTFPAVSQFWTFAPEEYLKLPAYTRDYPECKYCEAAR